MQALRKTRAAAGLELMDVPVPAPTSDDETLVRVSAAGICGSDLHVDDWHSSYEFMAPSLPVTIGHEFVGVPESGLLAGMRVVVRPSVTCGTCTACVAGDFDSCTHRSGIGMTRDGAFAQWVRVPLRNCVAVPDGLSDELASLAEPLSISMQALRVAGALEGRRVLVMGPGTIGQGIALLARRAGASAVVLTGHDDPARFEVLRQMGFEALADVAGRSLTQATAAYRNGEMFDLVFEATGVPETIAEALTVLRNDGTLIVTGIHARPLRLDLAALVRRQQQLRGSFRPPESAWPEALALIGDLKEHIAPMISHVLPLARAHEGFALARQKIASKVLLRPWEAA